MTDANAPARIGLLAFNGLGDLAAGELGVKRADYRKARVRDYELVTIPAGTRMQSDLANLKTVEDVFLLLGRAITVGSRGDLRALSHLITRERMLSAIELKNRVFRSNRPRRVSFKCFVKQDRDYKLRRVEIEKAVERATLALFPRWRVADPAALEIWAFYINGAVELGVRLSDAGMRYHGRKPARRQGALRPTIAAALVSVARIAEGERVIDPMCGSGTLVREVLDLRRAAQVVGGDIDAGAVGLAGDLQSAGSLIAQMDCRRLPLPDASFDCAVCNLPFGRQYSERSALADLYTECLAEIKRVLRPTGRMVLLTTEAGTLTHAAAALHLRSIERGRVRVLGLSAGFHVLSCG